MTAQEQNGSVVQSHTASRSYGLPDGLTPNEESEIEQEEAVKGIEIYAHGKSAVGEDEPDAYDDGLLDPLDDGLLDFGPEEHEETAEPAEAPARPEEDAKSSSTLQEDNENESEEGAAVQEQEQDDEDAEAVVQHAWNDWTYVEEHSEHDEQEYQQPEDNGEEAYEEQHGYGLVSSLEEPAEAEDEEFDLNEFANYPEPFSPFDKHDEFEDDGPLLGLEQHETRPVSAATKRAREDDDEEEVEEASDGEETRSSPVPASKRHKQI